MMKKSFRIQKKKEIDRIRFSRNNPVFSQNMVLNSIVNLDTNTFRLLISVSKKYSKKAVDRNKLRRRIWHCVYALHTQGRIPKHTDFHIVIKRGTPLLTYNQVLDQISQLFSK